MLRNEFEKCAVAVKNGGKVLRQGWIFSRNFEFEMRSLLRTPAPCPLELLPLEALASATVSGWASANAG